MEEKYFEQEIEEISALIAEAGYDPYLQLTGYISTGKEAYITRRGGARNRIRQLDIMKIKEHLDKK